MKTSFFYITILFTTFAYPQPLIKRPLSVSNLFSDHIVLERNAKVDFWGCAAPGQKLTISTGWGNRISTVTNADGTWKIKLRTPMAGRPYYIYIMTSEDHIELKDVLIGEVWLASGQSNMDIPLKGWPPGDTIQNSAREISKADYPEIRYFKVPFSMSIVPLGSTDGKWLSITLETAGNFSAHLLLKRTRFF